MGFMEVVLVAVPGMTEQRDIAPGVYWPDGEVSVLGLVSLHIKGMPPTEPFASSKNWLGGGQSLLSQKSLRWQTSQYTKSKKYIQYSICEVSSANGLSDCDKHISR